MVYRIVKWIASLALRSYFRKLSVTGKGNIPDRGPVIFVANHPSAFMDPMVVATSTRRPVHFIAAGEFFGKGLKSWIFRKQLHMIPVQREKATNGEDGRNDQMFSKCFDLLARGGAIVIFPEGNSITEKRVRKLKTGAARIALGVREYAQGKIEVTIVPVGLNYNNPHRFQSDLFVNIGQPMTTEGYDASRDGVIALTTEIEERLRSAVLHVQYEELDPVIKKVELMLKRKLGDPLRDSTEGKQMQFQTSRTVIQSIEAMHENQPELIRSIELKLNGYFHKIRRLGISDSSIATLSVFPNPIEELRLYAGRPLFVVGFLLNAIPYYSTVLAFRKLNLFPREGTAPPRKKLNPAFRGSIAISIGIIAFILWYLAWAAAGVWTTGTWWIGAFMLCFFYLAGLFTLRYLGWRMIADQKRKLRRILTRKSDLFSELISERMDILESLRKITVGVNIN